MSDIFLSYNHDDRERVRPIVGRLEARGWSVWWDRKVRPGEYWPAVIEEALKGCRVVVVVWTKASVKSKWVRLEAAAGTEIDGLVPILLDTADVPFEFKHVQAADLTKWDGVSDHPELDSALEVLDDIIGTTADASSVEQPTTLGTHTTLALSLSIGGDLGSTDPRDLMWIDSQVRSAGKLAVPSLLAALEFEDAPRRGHAAYLLGLTGDPSVIEALAPLLSDRSHVGIVEWLPTVRAAAALALKRIGTLESLRILAEAFE